MNPETDIAAIAEGLLAALDAHRPLPCLTATLPGFDAATAYRIAAHVTTLRAARGERPVGRKIGFTNTTIWDEYGVHAPIWGMVHDTTLRAAGAPVAAADFIEPRIEPEIVFRLAHAPQPGMDDAALMGCIDAVALGFEIVQSLFPGWRFRGPDTIAAFGLHGALVHGPFVPVAASRDHWRRTLAGFRITLWRDGALADTGRAQNVLGAGPLAALAHLVTVLAASPACPPLAPGEIVTTGTLTRALPVSAGECWTARTEGLDLPGPLDLQIL